MDTNSYINKKILEFEEKLQFIAECREKEMSKSIHERSPKTLFILRKDEILFDFCLTEFKLILEHT